MFWKKRPQRTETKKWRTAAADMPAAFVVTCTNGCTRLECTSTEEAQTFQRCMQRCPQCGGVMLEKGRKLVCMNSECGHMENREDN